jgi:hypothetical protein
MNHAPPGLRPLVGMQAVAGISTRKKIPTNSTKEPDQ